VAKVELINKETFDKNLKSDGHYLVKDQDAYHLFYCEGDSGAKINFNSIGILAADLTGEDERILKIVSDKIDVNFRLDFHFYFPLLIKIISEDAGIAEEIRNRIAQSVNMQLLLNIATNTVFTTTKETLQKILLRTEVDSSHYPLLANILLVNFEKFTQVSMGLSKMDKLFETYDAAIASLKTNDNNAITTACENFFRAKQEYEKAFIEYSALKKFCQTVLRPACIMLGCLLGMLLGGTVGFLLFCLIPGGGVGGAIAGSVAGGLALPALIHAKLNFYSSKDFQVLQFFQDKSDTVDSRREQVRRANESKSGSTLAKVIETIGGHQGFCPFP